MAHDRRLARLRATGKIGEAAAAAVERRFGERFPDLKGRAETAEELARLAPAPPETIAALVELLDTRDVLLWTAAAAALGGFGQAEPGAVAALVAALEDDHWLARDATLDAPVPYEPDAPGNEWQSFSVNQGHELDRENDVRVLASYRPVNRRLVAVLIVALRDKAWDVWWEAKRILQRIQPRPPEVDAALRTRIKSAHGYEIAEAAWALGRLRPVAPEVRDALVRLLRAGHGQTRSAAADALGDLGDATPEAEDALLAATERCADGPALFKGLARSQAGRASPRVAETLVVALANREDSLERAGAAAALGTIGQATPAIVAALLAALGDGAWQVRRDATRALGQVRPVAPEVPDALLALLDDPEWGAWSNTAQALGDIARDEPERRDALRAALARRPAGRATEEALREVG